MNRRSSDDISFGEWVRQRRHILDLTQQELADLVGCARITLRRIESGALQPSKELAQILLEKLGAPAKDEAWVQFARGRSGSPERVANSSSSRPITNLPTLLTSFIERENVQDEISNLIAHNRLITIAGAGGIGKTRLALQVGKELLKDYHNGVWFAEFDSLSDSALVTATVAALFDIREGSSDQPLVERLIYSLHAKTILLIFDNCEHLLDACAQLVKTLLTHCPNLKVLATSREVLNMEGEATYYLPSLSIPEDRAPLEKLAEYESIQLFIQRAALALSSFRMTKENAQTIMDICRRVDGIPLAVELAAAHVNILQTKEILQQLNESFSLLASDSRIALPRHQTMRVSLDWSWSLLSVSEQTFLRQLSVFAGGWTLESAQAVCEGNILSLTGSLVKKSLIMVNQKPEGQTRYHFHEMVRQYARQKLVQAGEEESIRTRHLNYFLLLSEKAEVALRGPIQTEWHVLLNDERDNIRAALEWADQSDNVEAGLYLSGRLQSFWETLDLSEGVRWLAAFLNKPESKSYSHARANALCTQAMLLFWMQEFDLTRASAQESLGLYRACGDVSGEIDSLLILASSYYNVRTAEIIELYQRALHLSISVEDQWRQAQALAQLGLAGTSGHDHQRSVARIKEAVALFQKVGDLELAMEHMISLGQLELLNGNPQLAQKWLDEAVKVSQNLDEMSLNSGVSDFTEMMALSRQLRNKTWLAYVFQIYGRIAFSNGNFEKAYAGLHKSIEMGQELGHRMIYFWSRTHLGYLRLQQGEITQAHDLFIDSAQNFQKDQNIIGIVFSLEGMAGFCVVVGKHQHAACLIGWADAMREKINDTRPVLEQADVDKIIAACLAKIGEVAFSDAYNEGQKMSMDEAVTYALEEG